MAATRTAVRRAISPTAPSRVLIAVSGGPDSLALAAATAFVTSKAGIDASALIVDHALQTGSDKVAARAARQCVDLGIRAQVVRVEVVGVGEAAARAARYEALDDAVAQEGADLALLGHTKDDQAEQVLLGLARGSGLRSLAAMPPTRGPYLRPFLGITRAQTEAACAQLGLVPWHDPMNTDGLRATIRHELLPQMDRVLGPGLLDALVRSAAQAREAADVVDDVAHALIVAAQQTAAAPAWSVDVLAAALPGARKTALRRILVGAGSPAGSVSARHVDMVDALITAWHGQGPVAVPGKLTVLRQGRVIMIASTGR